MGLAKTVIIGLHVMVCVFVFKVGMGNQEETDLDKYTIMLIITGLF